MAFNLAYPIISNLGELAAAGADTEKNAQ